MRTANLNLYIIKRYYKNKTEKKLEIKNVAFIFGKESKDKKYIIDIYKYRYAKDLAEMEEGIRVEKAAECFIFSKKHESRKHLLLVLQKLNSRIDLLKC